MPIRFQQRIHSAPAVVQYTALLCLVAVLAIAAVQAVHFHTGDSAEQTKQCSVCPSIVAAAIPTQAAPLNIAAALPQYVLNAFEGRPKDRLVLASLFTRPPPTA